MLIHPCSFFSGIGTAGCPVRGFAAPLREAAFRLVTVTVVIDVTRRLGLRLRT
jgi:hypothetical protein